MAMTKLEVAADNEITIDKNVPMPRGWGTPSPKYPWGTMEIGDSFVIPPEVQKHFSGPMSAAGRKHGRKFAQRKMLDGTYRCWRVQ